MSIRFLLGRAAACVGFLGAVAALGCGGGSVCDVDFGTIAGTYSFTWKTHSVDYANSCFDSYESPDQVDPADMTNCTWEERSDDATVGIEFVIEESGDVGNARITNVTNEEGEKEEIEDIGVQCELLKGEVCDAPIRCKLTGKTCIYGEDPDPNAWQYSCGCSEFGGADPMSAACQDCKASYDKYKGERDSYCEKGSAAGYFEFTLHVEE